MSSTSVTPIEHLQAQSPVVRDSAGVRIVENPARATARELFWMVQTPSIRVGGLEDDANLEFNHRQGYIRAVRLSNGGLAVIDEVRVHYFDAQGKRRFIVGGKGQGPRELLYATAICRTRGDTVLVGDSHNRRITVLDEYGQIVRTIAYLDRGSPPFDFCFDDGTFVLQRELPVPGDAEPRVRITRLSTTGDVVNVVGDFPGIRFDVVTRVLPVTVAAGSLLYFANPMAGNVQVYSKTGTLMNLPFDQDPPAVKALSGYLPVEGGEAIEYVLILNGGMITEQSEYRPIWAQLVTALTSYPAVVSPAELGPK